MALDLAELGLTNEELQERVVEAIASRVLVNCTSDDEGREYGLPSTFRKKLDESIKARIDKTISDLAAKHVLPNVAETVESLCLQATDEWGQKKGKPLSFVQYLVQRAEAYLIEKVDYSGKDKAECGGYSFSPSQTRITHLVHKHLHYSIETAMQEALKIANGAIATGIQETVKVKLAEIVAGLKTTVALKS